MSKASLGLGQSVNSIFKRTFKKQSPKNINKVECNMKKSTSGSFRTTTIQYVEVNGLLILYKPVIYTEK